MSKLNELDGNHMVIDLDTGTVLGTNLVVVPSPLTEEELESILSSDSAAIAYGEEHGSWLRVC